MSLMFLVQDSFESLGSTVSLVWQKSSWLLKDLLVSQKLHLHVGFFWMIDITTFLLVVLKKRHPKTMFCLSSINLEILQWSWPKLQSYLLDVWLWYPMAITIQLFILKVKFMCRKPVMNPWFSNSLSWYIRMTSNFMWFVKCRTHFLS